MEGEQEQEEEKPGRVCGVSAPCDITRGASNPVEEENQGAMVGFIFHLQIKKKKKEEKMRILSHEEALKEAAEGK